MLFETEPLAACVFLRRYDPAIHAFMRSCLSLVLADPGCQARLRRRFPRATRRRDLSDDVASMPRLTPRNAHITAVRRDGERGQEGLSSQRLDRPESAVFPDRSERAPDCPPVPTSLFAHPVARPRFKSVVEKNGHRSWKAAQLSPRQVNVRFPACRPMSTSSRPRMRWMTQIQCTRCALLRKA
jgi:hypothetical protein